MAFLKKEWKAVVVTLWLVIITVFLFQISGQLSEINVKNAKIASTLDSVESVAISTDAAVMQMSQKVNKIDSEVAFIVEKIRRR